MGIHHGVSKKEEPDIRISRSIESFLSVSNEKVDWGEAVEKKRKEALWPSTRNFWLEHWRQHQISFIFRDVEINTLYLVIVFMVNKVLPSVYQHSKFHFMYPTLDDGSGKYTTTVAPVTTSAPNAPQTGKYS